MRVRLSNAELERGRLRVHTLERSKAAFDGAGWVLFENAYDPGLIESLQRAFFARYGGLSEDDLLAVGSRVGPDRYMFAIDLEPPFLDPQLYANPFALALIRTLLGADCTLDSFSAVVAYPGAEDQHLHLDHSLLFEEQSAASMALPAYALTMVVPLVNLTERSGSTRLFQKTARAEPSLWSQLRGGEMIEASTGACWLMDYRLAHAGTRNPSQVPRPILYLVYTRKWFTDSENFRDRPRFSLAPKMKALIPEAYLPLFRRA